MCKSQLFLLVLYGSDGPGRLLTSLLCILICSHVMLLGIINLLLLWLGFWGWWFNQQSAFGCKALGLSALVVQLLVFFPSISSFFFFKKKKIRERCIGYFNLSMLRWLNLEMLIIYNLLVKLHCFFFESLNFKSNCQPFNSSKLCGCV